MHGATGWGHDTGVVSLAQLFSMLWRERVMVLVVAGLVAVAGIATVWQLPTLYNSAARVLVLYDDAYLHNSVLGDAQPRTILTPQQIIQAETDLLSSEELKRRVVREVGVETVFANRTSDEGLSEERLQRLEADAVRALNSAFAVRVAPNSPTISLSVRHEDPEAAALIANAMLDEYLDYRREVLIGAPPEGLERERRNTEERLAVLNGELEAVLAENQIGDFDGERTAARERAASVGASLLETRARLSEVTGAVAALRERMRAIPSEEEIWTEDAASQRLQELATEREELLAGYEPSSRAVAEIDARIDRVRAAITSGMLPNGLTRLGPNPVYQSLQTQLLQYEAERESLTERSLALTAQLDETRARQLQLQQVAPTFERLARERDALSATVRRFIEREEQGRALRALAEQAIDTVRIVERAAAPSQGSSLRRPAALGVIVLAGFAGLAAGLVSAFANRWSASGAPGSPAQSSIRWRQHAHLDQPPPRPGGGGRRRPRLPGEVTAGSPHGWSAGMVHGDMRPSTSANAAGAGRARRIRRAARLGASAAWSARHDQKRAAGVPAKELRADAIRRAQEVRRERLERRALAKNAPAPQNDNAFAELGRKTKVVRGQKNPDAQIGARAQGAHDGKAVGGVKGGRRLIEGEGGRLAGKGARDVGPSLFAAGQRAQRAVPLRIKADGGERPFDGGGVRG